MLHVLFVVLYVLPSRAAVDLEDNDEDGEDDLEDAIEELGAEGAEIVDAEADELAEAIKKTNI